MGWLGVQTNFLLIIQNFREQTGGVFDGFFLNITLFGEVFIPLFLICFFYWCVDKKIGFYILSSYLYCFLVNTFIKTTACIYRPWILEPQINPVAKAIPAATGYSFPSGHTVGAASVLGGLALSFPKNKILFYTCLSIILLVMFSRNYLGVHTPQDVIAAFIISCIILVLNKKILECEKKYSDLIILTAASLFCILLALYINYKSYPIDYQNGKLLYDPASAKFEIVTRIGFVLGAFWGWFIEKRFIKFSPNTGSLIQKIIRYVIGISILLGLVHAGGLAAANSSHLETELFFEYFIIAFFITCIYPFLFSKLKM